MFSVTNTISCFCSGHTGETPKDPKRITLYSYKYVGSHGC